MGGISARKETSNVYKILLENYWKEVMCETLTQWEKREKVFCGYVQCDSFGTRPKKMQISQRLFIRF